MHMPPSAITQQLLMFTTVNNSKHKATASDGDPQQEEEEEGAADEYDYSSKYRYSVAAILASAFLNLLGFTMAGPITHHTSHITPALGQHFSL
jgi:hypothetical protein